MFCLLATPATPASHSVLGVSHPTPTACRPRTWLERELAHWNPEVSEAGGKWLTATGVERGQARALPWWVVRGRLRPDRVWASPLDAGQQNALRLMSGLSERLAQSLARQANPRFSAVHAPPRFYQPPPPGRNRLRRRRRSHCSRPHCFQIAHRQSAVAVPWCSTHHWLPCRRSVSHMNHAPYWIELYNSEEWGLSEPRSHLGRERRSRRSPVKLEGLEPVAGKVFYTLAKPNVTIGRGSRRQAVERLGERRRLRAWSGPARGRPVGFLGGRGSAGGLRCGGRKRRSSLVG
jgi:hypothetical protein